MRVTANHHRRFLSDATVRLSKFHTAILCRISQFFQCLEIQLGIGWVRDVLFLNCRVDVYLCQFLPGDVFIVQGNRYGFFEQHYKLVGTDSLSPLR